MGEAVCIVIICIVYTTEAIHINFNLGHMQILWSVSRPQCLYVCTLFGSTLEASERFVLYIALTAPPPPPPLQSV